MRPTATTLLNRLLSRGKLRHVQVFMRLAELGSIQRTADAIGVTQSAVTQTLAYLEDLLDVPLFHRHARGVRLTEAGQDLVPLARQVMSGVSGVAHAVEARGRDGGGRVRLLASLAAMNGLLLDGLPAFAAENPDVHILLKDAEDQDQLLAIARSDVDLIACRRPQVIPEGWTFVPLCADRFAIVCRQTHPLARRRRPAKPGELTRATWMALPPGTAAREHLDALSIQLGMPLALHPIATRSPLMMWNLLLNQDLLTVLPVTLVMPHLQAGTLVELPSADTAALQPIGFLRPSAPVSSASGRLLAFFASRAAGESA